MRAHDALGCLSTIALALLIAAGCGRASKEDIVRKAEHIGEKAELRRVLGAPDDIQKLGPLETWTYKAANGQVVFLIVGDQVTLQAAGTPPRSR